MNMLASCARCTITFHREKATSRKHSLRLVLAYGRSTRQIGDSITHILIIDRKTQQLAGWKIQISIPGVDGIDGVKLAWPSS
jgi:hypothetical protein